MDLFPVPFDDVTKSDQAQQGGPQGRGAARVTYVVERVDGYAAEHRREDFILVRGVSLRDVRQHRGPEEVACAVPEVKGWTSTWKVWKLRHHPSNRVVMTLGQQ